MSVSGWQKKFPYQIYSLALLCVRQPSSCCWYVCGLRVCALLFQLLIICENKTNSQNGYGTPNEPAPTINHSIHMKCSVHQ